MRDLALVSVLLPMLAMAVARPFVGVLVWFWIAFMNPHREVWGFAQTQPWAMLAFLATVFGCFVAREPKKPAVNAVTVLMAMMIVWITITSFTALAPPDVVWKKWDRTLKTLLGLLLAASLLTDRRRVHAVVWLMAISMGFYGVKGGIFTLMTGGGFIVKGPPDSMIADRNHLAVALLTAVPLMNYLRQQSRHPIVQTCLLVAMVAMLFSAVGSQSRGALVGLVGTAAMLWLRTRGKFLSGIGILIGVAAAINFMPDKWVQRMQSIETFGEDASAMGRLRVWEAAWNIAVARPITGGGFRAVYFQDIVNRYAPGVRARATHSIWFEALGEQGFVGFAIWLGIFIAGAFYAFRIIRLAKGRPDLLWASDLARMGHVSLVAFGLGGTFLSLAYWDFSWMLTVVLAATHALVVQAVQQAPAAIAAQPAADAGWRTRGSAASQAMVGP